MLSIFLLAGTAAGALAVRPRAAYLLIPVPALAYLAAATVAGLVHDRAASSTALAISAARYTSRALAGDHGHAAGHLDGR